MATPIVHGSAFWWRAGVGGLVLGVLGWLVDWARFAAVVQAADAWWVGAVVALIHADKAWMAGKWLLLARGSGLTTPASVALKSYYVGSFWGCLLPASVGADVIRISWLTKRGHEVGTVAWSVVVERVLGALAQAITGLAGLILLTSTTHVDVPAFGGSLVVFVAIAAIAAALVFSEVAHELAGHLAARLGWMRVQRGLTTTKHAILGYRQRRMLLLSFLALSVLEQAFPVASTFALATAFSADVQLGRLVIAVPIILAMSRLPISIFDYGIKEGAYALMLPWAGLSLTHSVVIAMVDRILVLVAMVPGAFWTVDARTARPAPSVAADASRPFAAGE